MWPKGPAEQDTLNAAAADSGWAARPAYRRLWLLGQQRHEPRLGRRDSRLLALLVKPPEPHAALGRGGLERGRDVLG